MYVRGVFIYCDVCLLTILLLKVMKKYRACVASLSEEQRAAKEASAKAAIAEEEARAAQEKAAELAARLASLDNATTIGQAAQHDK